MDGSVAKTIAGTTRAELIVIDDIGLLPAGQAALTSNTLATATVDRPLSGAHVVLTEDTSLRLAEAIAGREVVPLE